MMAGLTYLSPRTARCTLYKNNHDGTFTDVTEHAGIATPGWTTSAVWFDYDNDGRLDLFVCSFVDYSGGAQVAMRQQPAREKLLLCSPGIQPDGQLSVSQQRRRHFHRCKQGHRHRHELWAKGLGVVATDINNDGRMDLFVANDTVQNFLFVNRGPGQAAAGSGTRSRCRREWVSATTAAAVGNGRGCRRSRW